MILTDHSHTGNPRITPIGGSFIFWVFTLGLIRGELKNSIAS